VEAGGRSMTENEAQERHTEEFVKLCFEVFKHLTTLSTAGALVILALYSEISIQPWLVALTLALFGITILISLLSMIACTGYFSTSGSWPSKGTLGWSMAGASGSFMVGVEAFMLLLFEWPNWVNFILLPAALLILVVLIRQRPAFLRRDRRPPPQEDQQEDQAKRQEQDLA